MRLFSLASYCRLCLIIVIFASTANAQRKPKLVCDSNYIKRYDTLITSRTFISRKYLALEIKDSDTAFKLKYRPNSKLNFGAGGSYGWLNLNLGIGIAPLGPGQDEKADSKAIDLQLHIYSRKIILDFFGQYYKGFFLIPEKTATGNGKNWYVRPDMTMWQAGISGYYSLNWRKFSYRAAYIQNEWQVKSAGSVLVGAELFFEKTDADSAFVPSRLRSSYRAAGVDKIVAGDMAASAGYAYTLVLAKHFFASGSAIGSLSLNLLTEESGGLHHTYVAFTPNYGLKAAIGYNSRRFTTSVTWVHNAIIGVGSNTQYTFQAGVARFHLAYRFPPGPRLKRTLRFAAGQLLGGSK